MPVHDKSMKAVGEFLLKHQKGIFFVLTLLAGIVILSGRCDYQAYVSQGDHGRDLYAFKRVLHGAVPYRDFSWLFGPLMVYYYGAFFKIMGPSIQAALAGQNVLIVLTGCVLYLAGVRFLSPALSFLCALWYWLFRGEEFFYTYNHSGGLLCMVIMIYTLFRYIEDGKTRHILWGLVVAFFFALIRFNMACAALAGWGAALILTDIVRKNPFFRRNMRVLVYGSLVCGLAAFCVYWLYLRGLPLYVIWESFPVSKAQRTDTSLGLVGSLQYLGQLLFMIYSSGPVWKCLAVLLAACTVGTIAVLARKQDPASPDRTKIILCLVALGILAVLTLHEYLLSGIFYRLYWALPVALLIMFFLFGCATSGPRYKVGRVLLYIALFWIAFLVWRGEVRKLAMVKVPSQMLEHGRTRVYTLQNAVWFATVQGACVFIEKNVPPGEKLFSIPFDTLYNFLTYRDQPTRQWTYFQHFLIPEEQERQTIADLEREKVNWILLSNRAISLEPGLGIFGREYCHILWKYIYEHYDVVANFGIWTSRASWAWDHGVVILRRKVPFPTVR